MEGAVYGFARKATESKAPYNTAAGKNRFLPDSAPLRRGKIRRAKRLRLASNAVLVSKSRGAGD